MKKHGPQALICQIVAMLPGLYHPVTSEDHVLYVFDDPGVLQFNDSLPPTLNQ